MQENINNGVYIILAKKIIIMQMVILLISFAYNY